MRYRLAVMLLMLAATVPPTEAVSQEADDRPGIGVLPFDLTQLPPVDLGESGLNFGLQQILISELGANSALRVVERREISAIMAELDLHGSGRVDAATAARIGEIVGARYMIGGTYRNWHGKVEIHLRVFSVETTEIIATTVTDEEDVEQLGRLMREGAAALTANLDLPPLPREAEERRGAFEPTTEAIDLFSYAVARDEHSEPDKALETLELLIDRWPEYGDAVALRDEIRNR